MRNSKPRRPVRADGEKKGGSLPIEMGLTLSTVLNTAFATRYADAEAYHDYAMTLRRDVIGARLAHLIRDEFKRAERRVDVLDLGGGTGIVSVEILKKSAVPCRCVVTDLDERMLALVPRSALLETRIMDFNRAFPFPAQSFDVVTSVWANRYIDCVAHFLARVYQVLRPGGIFIWPLFDLENLFFLWTSRDSLISAVQEAGFRIERVVNGQDNRLWASPWYVVARKVIPKSRGKTWRRDPLCG